VKNRLVYYALNLITTIVLLPKVFLLLLFFMRLPHSANLRCPRIEDAE
jgi:hypothetical protein